MSLTYLLSILSYHLILSCTFIYILILFIYGTFVCFNLVLFMYCTFICLLHVLVFFHLSVLCLITLYVLLHISFLRLCIYHVLFHVMATRPCYTFHSSFSYLYYHILSYYMFLSCTFHMLSSCIIHILCIHLYVLILSYTLCFRILSVFFLYWFKANTFISYIYFSYYVNFYLIFPISRMSIRLIFLLSYTILFIYLSIFSTLCTILVHNPFVYYTLYFLYTVLMYCSCNVHVLFFIYLYLCNVHLIYYFPVILFI